MNWLHQYRCTVCCSTACRRTQCSGCIYIHVLCVVVLRAGEHSVVAASIYMCVVLVILDVTTSTDHYKVCFTFGSYSGGHLSNNIALC